MEVRRGGRGQQRGGMKRPPKLPEAGAGLSLYIASLSDDRCPLQSRLLQAKFFGPLVDGE